MQRQLRVTVDGHTYDVTVEDLTNTGNLYPNPSTMAPPPSAPAPAPSAPPQSGATTPPPASGAVVASMSGVLVELLVGVGDQVNPGDAVAIIEAMKMKSRLVVDQSGTVAGIDAAVGEPVQAGQTLMTLS
ncbi:MAG: acetyl-CoA carboxylase biotin carboxyl carrier protein subunit [Micrococcales bacterium]|nr:MAG: acetyl-CoA carboxylase biotin carboxyl carrier protein subunit [Micrococcales bacterium]PIE27012.1 MAG: acetyl-CoA carboxylase biotin carboxyl carrier protein subunit [Micrococcales bacterium]